jgi:hypothetical protein
MLPHFGHPRSDSLLTGNLGHHRCERATEPLNIVLRHGQVLMDGVLEPRPHSRPRPPVRNR